MCLGAAEPMEQPVILWVYLQHFQLELSVEMTNLLLQDLPRVLQKIQQEGAPHQGFCLDIQVWPQAQFRAWCKLCAGEEVAYALGKEDDLCQHSHKSELRQQQTTPCLGSFTD